MVPAGTTIWRDGDDHRLSRGSPSLEMGTTHSGVRDHRLARWGRPSSESGTTIVGGGDHRLRRRGPPRPEPIFRSGDPKSRDSEPPRTERFVLSVSSVRVMRQTGRWHRRNAAERSPERRARSVRCATTALRISKRSRKRCRAWGLSCAVVFREGRARDSITVRRKVARVRWESELRDPLIWMRKIAERVIG